MIKLQCGFNTLWHNKNETFQILVVSENKLVHQQSFGYDMFKCNINNVMDAPYSEYNNFVEQSFCLPLKNDIDSYLIKVISQNMIDVDAYIQIDLKDLKIQASESWTNKVDKIPQMDIAILRDPVLQVMFQDILKLNSMQFFIYNKLFF